jgi:DegV family protein with EDD domain
MKYPIALITDSTCDIPQAWREEYEISVVPLTIHFGNETFLDGVTLSPEAFYERLEREAVHPTTSQPSPQDFLNVYQKVRAEGAQEIIVFTISSAMSGTIESARLAAQDFPVPIHIVDSKNNSMGLGWQVIAAARAREKGANAQEMMAVATKVREKMVYYVSLNTMKYLEKGGRIGKATKFLASLLQIKPLIYVDPATGVVHPSIPARSRNAAIDGLFKEFFKHMDTSKPMHITVLHNAARDEAEALAERVKETFHPAELFITIVSPVLGAHTGPKAIALCGYSEPD